jgi:hypothetical protein
MSYVYRKIKKYIINLLEVFAFNSYWVWFSFVLAILTWFDLFGVATIYVAGFIIVSYNVGWWYKAYKFEKENELLRTVNTCLSKYEAEDVREDLAALMHNIWTEDIFKTDLTLDEQYRANTPYYDLSDDDKQVNLSKADEVLHLISSRRKDSI